MPLKPIIPDRETDWIPPSQVGDESPTTFKIRPITSEENRYLDNITSSVDQTENHRYIRTGDVLWWRVKFGLAGVENYDVPFKMEPSKHTKRKCVADAFLETLPHLEFCQLAGAIADYSDPDEGE